MGSDQIYDLLETRIKELEEELIKEREIVDLVASMTKSRMDGYLEKIELLPEKARKRVKDRARL